mgnify:CR=1 FL=1
MNPMMFNKAQCKLLHPHWSNSKHKYRLMNEGIERRPVEKKLGVAMDEKLDCQAVHSCSPATRSFACTKRGVAAGRQRGLSASTLPLKDHLEYCVQTQGLQNKKDVELWGWANKGGHKDDQRAGVSLL